MISTGIIWSHFYDRFFFFYITRTTDPIKKRMVTVKKLERKTSRLKKEKETDQS